MTNTVSLIDIINGLLTHTESNGIIWVRQDDVLACIIAMGETSEGLTDKLADAESSGDLGAPTPSPAKTSRTCPDCCVNPCNCKIIPNGTKTPENGKNESNSPERDDFTSEIPVVENDCRAAFEAECVKNDWTYKNESTSDKWHGFLLAWNLCTTKPVVVSLGKCFDVSSAGADDEWASGRDPVKRVRAVLDYLKAQGVEVAYVD